MNKPKYKQGDRVIITRRPTKTELGNWYNTWPNDMDRMIGKAVTIDSRGYRSKAMYEYVLVETGQSWPECVMRPELISGKQLLLWEE